MNTLRDWQAAFSHALQHGETCEAESWIDPEGLSAKQRLGIYRHQTGFTLIAALRALYPVVEKLVGPEYFHQAASFYWRRYPPKAAHLHGFGDRFADFLQEAPGAEDLYYLPDVARLEWHCHSAYHSADASCATPQAKYSGKSQNYPAGRFGLSGNGRLFVSLYPILQIWEAHQRENEDDLPLIAMEQNRKHYLMIWRDPIWQICVSCFSGAQFALLEALQKGKKLTGAADDRLSTEDTDFIDHLITFGALHETAS